MTLAVPSRAPLPYFVDPEDPRAPPTEVWNAMAPEERLRVAEALPSDFPLDSARLPQGDRHFSLKRSARQALSRYFARTRRRAYVSNELPIYYPGQPMIAGHVIVVLGADAHERDRWLVDLEGKGIDFLLEAYVHGKFRDDMRTHAEKYASLGIPEYFVFDMLRGDIHGFALPSSGERAYNRVLPQQGRFPSRVLGMDLTFFGGKLRFLVGDAALPDADELLAQLGAALDEHLLRKQEAERRVQDLEDAFAEKQLREEIERQIVEARAEIERLKQAKNTISLSAR